MPDPKNKKVSRDTVRINKPSKIYKPNDYVTEDDFEKQFAQIKGDPSTFPQQSVEDYSNIQVDDKGPYVVRNSSNQMKTEGSALQIKPKTAKAMYKAGMEANKDKIAQERYGEFGFDTLTYDQQQEVYKKNPKLPRSSKDIGSDFETPAKMGSALYAKLSAGCKAAARKKFDVYPSAYANMWASKQQKKGKC
tara:strand:+ start:351 stop:926 length:576 start_codon:yes stop_codon:yes gene_type:complete